MDFAVYGAVHVGVGCAALCTYFLPCPSRSGAVGGDTGDLLCQSNPPSALRTTSDGGTHWRIVAVRGLVRRQSRCRSGLPVYRSTPNHDHVPGKAYRICAGGVFDAVYPERNARRRAKVRCAGAAGDFMVFAHYGLCAGHELYYAVDFDGTIKRCMPCSKWKARARIAAN